ncbi:MAG: FtsX-like permease family protein [Campylobacteraceae bacterium]|jgi:putative ABC transport system permease protein|nr:FtsX-like permease family protein [Campylobacteraceae bacterium]
MKENRKGVGFFLKVIFKSLTFSFVRVSIIFISVALGSAITAAFTNIYLDIESKMNKELKAYGANFVITGKNDSYILFDEYLNAISKIDENSLLGNSPYLYGIARLSLGNGVIAGVDFAQMKKTKPFLEIRNGSYINVDFDERNAIVGVDLAKKMELKVGSDVDIINSEDSKNNAKVKIKGIISTGEAEDNILFISLPLAQKILKKENYINFAEAVVLGNFGELTSLGENISNSELNARALARISRSEGLILDKIKLLMALVAFTVLVITSMCVNTTLSSIIFSRVKEIALLRALGASKSSIATLFGAETFIITFTASLIGAFGGFLLSQALGVAIFGSGIDFRFLSVPTAVLVSLISAACASYYPIKKSLNIKVANILRGE